MVRSKDELLEIVNAKYADDTSDDTLSFIEDVSDTLAELEAKTKDSTDWKTKYEENDKAWREKYKSRFFDEVKQEENTEEYNESEIPAKTFDDLFTRG